MTEGATELPSPTNSSCVYALHATLKGYDPSTSRVTGGRSTTELQSHVLLRARNGLRSRDLLLGKQVLYLLSYSRIRCSSVMIPDQQAQLNLFLKTFWWVGAVSCSRPSVITTGPT
jgi:hypothetical protein